LPTREKERLIIDLIKKGYNWSTIAKTTNSSPNTIQKTIEKYEQSKPAKIKSSRSKALVMYDKGCTPFEVTAKLDISPDDAIEYRLAFLKLKGMNKLEEWYRENADQLPEIMMKFREKQVNGSTIDQVADALYLLDSISKLQIQQQELERNTKVMNIQYEEKNEELKSIFRQVRGLKRQALFLRHTKERLLHEREKLMQDIEKLDSN
jgi:hypothetical protein